MSSFWAPSIQETYWHTGASSVKPSRQSCGWRRSSWTWEEKLRDWGWFNLERRRLWGDRTVALHGGGWEHRAFIVVHGGRTRDNEHKWNNKGSDWIWGETLFLSSNGIGCTERWAVNTQLDTALSSLLWSQSWPFFEQQVGLGTSWGPLLPELSYEWSLHVNFILLPCCFP